MLKKPSLARQHQLSTKEKQATLTGSSSRYSIERVSRPTVSATDGNPVRDAAYHRYSRIETVHATGFFDRLWEKTGAEDGYLENIPQTDN